MNRSNQRHQFKPLRAICEIYSHLCHFPIALAISLFLLFSHFFGEIPFFGVLSFKRFHCVYSSLIFCAFFLLLAYHHFRVFFCPVSFIVQENVRKCLCLLLTIVISILLVFLLLLFVVFIFNALNIYLASIFNLS